MDLVFFGTPQFAVPTLKVLLGDDRLCVRGVVTQPDKRRGRGNQFSPSPVKEVAIAHNLPVWQPDRIKKDATTLEALGAIQADAFVVVAYGQILSLEILQMPRLGCINGHGSILPKYRGAAPIQWSLVNGDRVTGITTMHMDVGMDTGPMLLEATTPIGLLETAQDLAVRLADLTAALMVETLLQLEAGTLPDRPQDPDQATYAPLIQKADYRLDWAKPAIALHHQVRGFYPNCTATFRGSGMKVIRTMPLGPEYWAELPDEVAAIAPQWESLSQRVGNPGEVMQIAKGLGPIVQTGEGLLLVQEVQLAGKRSQMGADFANGMRLEMGETFGMSEA